MTNQSQMKKKYIAAKIIMEEIMSSLKITIKDNACLIAQKW